MAKRIIFGTEARAEIKKGLDIVANAIKITIGPKGRNLLIDKGIMPPLATNDGVSGSDNIVVKDSAQRLGAEVGKNVARKTNEAVGDGTTTSLVLTQAIYNKGLTYLEKGVNVISLKKGIDKATASVIDSLKKVAIPITDSKSIKQVATISAESEELGTVIADTIDKIGKDGVITIEDSQIPGITSHVVEGMELKRGFISAGMVTNPDKGVSEQEDAMVFVTDKKIVLASDLIPVLEVVIASGKRALFLVCEDLEGEALATVLINKARGVLNITAIKTPGFGLGKKDLLEDITTVVGGRVFFNDAGEDLSKVIASDFGNAKRVIVSREKTIIVGPNDRKDIIEKRVSALKEQLKTIEGKVDQKSMNERINTLAGGVATIRVGAVTETEQKYLKLKLEDAVNATKAAIEEGVVAGGGSAFAFISLCRVNKFLKFFTNKKFQFDTIKFVNKDEEIGFKIVMEAILAPITNILINAGYSYDEIDNIIHEIQNSPEGAGFDALNGLFLEDMIGSGVIDPVKVSRKALENAASAAGTLLTTDVVICEENKESNG